MLRSIATLGFVLMLVADPAQASPAEDCAQTQDADLSIEGCTQVIARMPNRPATYTDRGVAYQKKGEVDRAIADFSRAIAIDSKYAKAYANRGHAYNDKGETDLAIADFTKAIALNPKYPTDFNGRGRAHSRKGNQDRALADFTEALRLDAKNFNARLGLGRTYLLKGEHDRALAELSEAMRLLPNNPLALTERGAVYEANGQIKLAVADYRRALELKGAGRRAPEAHAEARRRLAAIEKRAHTLETVVAKEPDPKPKVATTGRRVALVIANSSYGSVGRLTNPANDGRAIAASLRRLGFAEVIERYDLTHAAMGTALKEFGDRTVASDWAVVYFAGHGIEVNGTAYLIPVDAKLERDTHVADETVPLSRVLEKVESALKLRLVILDACRNNPFVSRMVRSGVSRSIGRGLGQIEPEGGVLVAYAAKHGTTAEDGGGDNSPFAEALIANIEEPGLEINFLFRKVRDQVLTKTGKRQEPYLYGSLPSESLFFKRAEAR